MADVPVVQLSIHALRDLESHFELGTRPLELLGDGYAYGSVSMAAYTLDARCPAGPEDARPSAGLPDPSDVPAEESNA